MRRFIVTAGISKEWRETDFQRLKALAVSLLNDYDADTIKSLLAEALEEIDLERNPPPPDDCDIAKAYREAEEQ